ncbi:MAG: aminotransferase class I/II-fold pyridoxal phosphate-dependent enzyme [Candidatus Zixiibacteriota bacterium]
MPLKRFVKNLTSEIEMLQAGGVAKGEELIVVEVIPPTGDKGARFKLHGFGDQEFIRMNSNSYLGMSLREKVIRAEETAAHKYGVGPGAVRFISGTYDVHVELEQRLAAFHGREACMLTSSAYSSVLGVITSLTTSETIIISDELNHNCIINGMRMARPKDKKVYKHLNMYDLEEGIKESIGRCDNLLIITDGVFSMRGVLAPLDQICALTDKYNHEFPRDIVLMVDDSHGVGALGKNGRGTEELMNAKGVDILVATLGKALGVNGGYVVSSKEIIRYLREKCSLYIYTNPITPPEAAAALASLEILQSDEGHKLLAHLHAMTERFEKGMIALGYETLASPHPVTPLLVRDTERTTRLVKFLRDHGVLATGLNYPVVPRGEQLIRFQINADHTAHDIDYVLNVLKQFAQAV